MISMLSAEEEKDFLLAGKIAAKALHHGKSLMKEGALVADVLDRIEDYILSLGAGIAFPAQISKNTIAAHACADSDDKETIEAGDVIKLDVGAHVNGFIGDNALTVNLDKEHQDLLNASKRALEEAAKVIAPGVAVGEVGQVIEQTITDLGFLPVRNLSGHGLGQYEIHTTPSMPNVGVEHSQELEEGMTIAIEPFATDGKGAIAESGAATVYTFLGGRGVRSPLARKLIPRLQSFNGLPFASRWLSRDFGVAKTRLALRELERAGMVASHPPLREIGHGLVSQHEYSFLVRDKPIISTRYTDD